MNKIPLLVDSLSLFALLMMLLFVGFANSDMGNMNFGNGGSKHSASYKYDRIDEVNKECAFVLAEASELKPDDNRVYKIKDELSFMNGDWNQELNGVGASIMPYNDFNELPTDRTPMNLVSFWLTDVDQRHRFNNSIVVSGILLMGITFELLPEISYNEGPVFNSWPGNSQLSVRFQGIYTESQRKNGERVLCLLGNAVLPSRKSDLADPWGRAKESGYTYQLSLVRDDQILLVIMYPRTFTLRSRVISGSMKSLNPKSNPKYFDEVRISSRLTTSNYEFMADDLVSRACDLSPYEDGLMNGEIEMYKGLDFCTILQRFSNQEALSISPNWKCNSTDDFCSKLGPFMLDKEINATDGSFKNVKLVLQDVRCENLASHDNAGSAKISSVFRAVPPSENQYVAAQRTVLNNMTLSAEGIWNSSSGQLCMVGCLGIIGKDRGDGCDFRICLYIPLSFSVKQRSILLGSLSSIDHTARLYFPLEFGKQFRADDLWNQYTTFHPYYKYSKINSAGAVLEKDEPFNFGTVIRKSLLTFPKADDKERFPYSLFPLFEDLTLHLPAVPDPLPSSFLTKSSVEMEILSLGPMFGRYGNTKNYSTAMKENPDHDMTTERQLLVNVSCQLKLSGEAYSNFSELSVEGIYDPRVGKMYLVGCRDVRASWKILYESMDLEAGLDCLLEVIISYPPTTSRWLVNPTATISITSQRNEDDPLYFAPIKLQTVPLLYNRQREDTLSRRGVEGMLRILTLSMATILILSQLFYIRDNTESTPFISLVMLGIQALGYSLPLITDAEALFKKAATELNNESYELQNSQWISVINYSVKFLVLLAFSVTLRLCQKVWRSRVRMLTRAPLEPHRVPSEKRVFLTTLIIHTIGYVIVLIAHYVHTGKKPLQTSRFYDSKGYLHTIHEWEIELEEYLGLIQDFFLLPQVISNLVWQIHLRPLRKTYYIGLTAIRLLPHLYNYIKAPIPNPYYAEQYEFVNPRMDFYSKFGDIAILIFAIFLALVVYVQQRWNYAKISEKLVLGQAKLLPLGSKVYERLPSMSFEAELVSDVFNNPTYHEKGHDAE